jgi:hypothetical protein
MTTSSTRSGCVTPASRSLLPRIDPLDLPALRDLARFGVMAGDQLARRYADPTLAKSHLPMLVDDGFAEEWTIQLEGGQVYSPTRQTRLVTGVTGLNPHVTRVAHLAHDVALVDLADHLVANVPDLRWFTEDEVAGFLNQIAPAPRRSRGDTRHRPDGLIVHQNLRIAIELEHTAKDPSRYQRISSWYIKEFRVDRVRWYVDRPRVLHALRRVNEAHGFDRDMHIELVEFPPGVRVRQQPGRFVRRNGAASVLP